MYSPFYDKKGKPLDINKIRYSHLIQLKERDEGHHLEFKEKLEENGRHHLPKEIASFANCEGGWLIIGITDDGEIKPISKADK